MVVSVGYPIASMPASSCCYTLLSQTSQGLVYLIVPSHLAESGFNMVLE